MGRHEEDETMKSAWTVALDGEACSATVQAGVQTATTQSEGVGGETETR